MAVTSNCTPGVHEGTFKGWPVRIQIPDTAVNAVRLPAVIVLHGGGDDGRFAAQQTQFGALGQTKGFISVFPSAPNGEWPLNDRGTRRINSLAASLSCADASRIYLTGFSRGSAMTFRVACTAEPRRFAAFGGVAFPDYFRRCRAAVPAPVIYFHGLKDATVSYTDGYRRASGRTTPGAQEAMRWWAQHNGCRKGPQDTDIGTDVVRSRFASCRKKAAVHFYTITDGDHQWPFRARPNAPLLSSGQSWASVGATEKTWQFFSARSLPRT